MKLILTWIIIIGYAISSENVSTIYCMPTEKYSLTKTVQVTAVSAQPRRVHIIALQEITWYDGVSDKNIPLQKFNKMLQFY